MTNLIEQHHWSRIFTNDGQVVVGWRCDKCGKLGQRCHGCSFGMVDNNSDDSLCLVCQSEYPYIHWVYN